MSNMENLILSSTTRTTLQNFLQIWKKQVENIIKRLQESRKSKKGCIGILEAHYYLGKLLEENISQHDQIKRQLEHKFDERQTRDLWTSAQRQKELFTICDRSRLY